MPISTLKALTLALGLLAGSGAAIAQTAPAKFPPAEIADDALVKLLPGFERATAEVNGTQLHYVAGGKGRPVLLLPGWPQTWWSYHKVMPELAKRYRVIAVDLRGMGGSAKPASGYDKKTMARDIHELVRALGYDKADIVGHDIGTSSKVSLRLCRQLCRGNADADLAGRAASRCPARHLAAAPEGWNIRR